MKQALHSSEGGGTHPERATSVPRVIVITGGSSGIGHATALEFARRGDCVTIAARGGEALARAAAAIEAAGGQALAITADVARFDDVARIAGETIARFGRIDVWINNAAVGEWGTVESLDIETIDRVIAVDLLGTIYGCKAVLPHLRARGRGVIINVASGLAERAIPLLSTYSAAKAGVRGFTEALRMELTAEKSGIDVVLVLPASINTPFYSNGPSRLGVRPRPVSVIYPPQTVAEDIVRVAEKPQRELYAGDGEGAIDRAAAQPRGDGRLHAARTPHVSRAALVDTGQRAIEPVLVAE